MTLAELNGHLDMVTQLHSARLTLQSLQDRILGAQQYDGMPHGHDASRKVESLSILLKEQSDDVDRLERIVARSEKNIRKWIGGIPDNQTKVIFNLRFLCGMKWEDVSCCIGMDTSSDAARMAVYRYLNQDQPPK